MIETITGKGLSNLHMHMPTFLPITGHKLSHTGQVGWTDSLLILGCIQCLRLLGHDNSHHLMQGTAQDC